MGGRTRKLRNAARRAGTPVAKGKGMLTVDRDVQIAAITQVVAPKKKKAAKKK